MNKTIETILDKYDSLPTAKRLGVGNPIKLSREPSVQPRIAD